jgi:hypothetical protein
MSQEWNTEFSNKGRGKEPGGTMHFSEISGSTVKEHDDIGSGDYLFRKSTTSPSYAMMHSSRSTSREPKKKKASASTKIYSQLLTGRQIQQRGKHIFIKVTNGYL